MGEEEKDYSDMTAKELYKLCKEREIDVEPRKKADYYIDLLEQDDEESDGWGDDDEDGEDEWEDEE